MEDDNWLQGGEDDCKLERPVNILSQSPRSGPPQILYRQESRPRPDVSKHTLSAQWVDPKARALHA